MLLFLTTLACGFQDARAVAAEPPPALTAEPGAAAVPVVPATPPVSWPATQQALETMLPGDALGPSTPIVDELGGSIDTEWTLLKPVAVADALCSKSIYVTIQSFACTLGAAYSSSNPKLTLRAGSVVTFGYGASRLTHFSIADVEPATKRVVVEGVPCADYITLEDGHFAGCVLSEDRAFGTLIIPAGSDVQKYGQLQVVAGRAFEAEGQTIAAGGIFTADLDGKLIHVFADDEGGD